MIPRYCATCGAEYRRVGVPCPEGIPGCAVFHFKLVCPTCDAAPGDTSNECGWQDSNLRPFDYESSALTI